MDKRKNEGAYAAAAAASLAMTHFHVPTDSIVSTAASITKNMGSPVYPTLPIELYATANRALAETFSRYYRQEQIVQNKMLLFNPAVENLMRDTVEAASASTINSFRTMQSYAERRNVVLRPNWSSSTATLLSSNHLGGTLDFLSDTSPIGRNQHQNQNDGQAKPHTRHPRYKIVRRDVAHDSQKSSRKRKRHSRGPAEDETVNYDIFQQDNSLSWEKAVEIAANIITIMVYFGVTPSYIQQVMNALLVNLAKLTK